MKRRSKMLVMVLAVALAFSLTACGGSDSDSADAADGAEAGTETAETEEAGTEAAAETTAAGYTVTLRDVTIEMAAEADPIVAELGDDYSYFESESCAFEGLDKVYSYPGFKLNTYPDGEVDYVLSVVFMDDTVETGEGICIGSARDDVIEAYGEPDSDTGAALIYEKEATTLTIGISSDSVSSIEIAAVTE